MRFLLLILLSINLFSFELNQKSVIYSQDKEVAKELQKYLNKIFSSDIKIVNKPQKNSIELSLKKSSNHHESFLISSQKDTLKITSSSKRGLFYGVYFFLEDYLGCRFLTKDVEIIPKRKKIVFKDFKISQTPHFAYREIFSRASEDKDFAKKLFLNGRLGHRVTKDTMFRNIYNQFSSKALLGNHFECSGQYDFANKDAQKTALENLKKKLLSLSVKDDDYIYIQHEDKNSFCKEKEDFLDYTIYLALGVKKPMLYEAYQWSRDIKIDKKLPKNLSVFFSTIDANFAKPLFLDENQKILESLKKWNQQNRDILIWHYISNFGGYLQPTPNIYSTDKDIKVFSTLKNIKGIFLQGSYDSSIGDLDELKNWVFAKLLWDPKKDVKSLIKEFCDAYYQESSSFIQKYIVALESLSKKLDRRLYVKTSVELEYFNLKYLDYLEDILKKGYKKASSKEIKQRVLKVLSGVLYVKVIKGVASKKEKVMFYNFLKNKKEENFAEGRSVKELFKLLSISKKSSTPPKIVKGLKKQKDWYEFQEYALKLCCTKYTDDKKSSDGVAAVIDGDKRDWAFQLDVVDLPKGKWDVYASVKVKKSASLSKNLLPALYYGVDPSSKGVVFSAQLKDGVYKDIKIATIDTKNCKDYYVWISPTGNSAVKKVYLDRFFLVRRK